jgi:hypothetical protein
MTFSIGQNLVEVVQKTQSELWLVAPFIKVNALIRLLSELNQQVKICCVTRWRPEEIAMGVSDIDIWLLLNERSNSQLWIRNDLHAKYYRADETCLIGSANLTATALGWASNPNLELLLDVPINHPSLVNFESELIAKAILVNDGLYEQTKDLVAQLEPEIKSLQHLEREVEFPEISNIDRETWLPSLRNPEQLYWAYRGEKDKFSSGIYEVAIADLHALGIPLGLSQLGFEAYVGYVLLQMPIVQKVDIFVAQPRRFGEVSAYLKTLPCTNLPDFDSKFAWQTLMRWLLCFLPTRYSQWTTNYTEMLQRNKRMD